MPTLNNFVMSYVLRKFKNIRSSANNRWFAYVNKTGNITTRGLAEYLIQLGVMLDRSDLEKVIVKLSQAIPAIVAQGYGVKIEGLGIFYPSIANEKGGAETPADFNVAQNIKGVRFNFRPDSTDLDNLTTKAFGKKVSFGNGYYQEQSGKKAPMIPLAAAEEPEP